MVTRPRHTGIGELWIMPTDQVLTATASRPRRTEAHPLRTRTLSSGSPSLAHSTTGYIREANETPARPDVCVWPTPRKLAILMAMSMTEQMSLADVKNRLSEVVDRLQKEHGRVVITKHGHPAAVVISLDDLESLEETLDVMDSAALLDDIREALADSDTQVLNKEDALRLITDR